MPHSYYSRVMKEELNVDLGNPNSYGTGIVFLPKVNESSFEALKEIFESQVQILGMKVLGWRTVQTGKYEVIDSLIVNINCYNMIVLF